jgi:hypothetical protein
MLSFSLDIPAIRTASPRQQLAWCPSDAENRAVCEKRAKGK